MEVDDVIAHAIYDPVARRQRYLKTRQLKGRKQGVQVPPKANAGRGEVKQPSTSFRSTAHVNRTAVSQALSTERQVAAIRSRLTKLKAHLNELLAKKKAESTSSSSSDSSESETKSNKNKNTKPKTAKQKAAAKEALKKAQKERAKQEKAEPDKQKGGTSLSLDEQITKTRAVIADVETKLRAAINSSRTETASNSR